MIQSLEFLGFNSIKADKCVFISTCSCQQDTLSGNESLTLNNV